MKPVQQGSEGATIVRQELRLLGRVTSVLSALTARQPGAPDYDSALINLRDQMAEAKPEDIPALVEQMTRIAAIAQRYGHGRDLPVDAGSPYFAHLALEEGERKRHVLIGKRGFIDREHGIHIVDWRHAPVSRIYYRYDEGDDYEERFGRHTIEGQVTVRRTVTIENARLRRIGAPQGIFVAAEDGQWFESAAGSTQRLGGGQGTAKRPPVLRRGQRGSQLGHGRGELRPDKHLPEIAALIDPAQFELITHPDSGLVVLQGGAGTGKTTVALHRVAYLAFAAPRRFRPDRMVVVVPSEAMVRYVERVLPDLGVAGVRAVTTRRWLEGTRQKVLPGTPKAYADDAPAVVLRFKKHPLLLALAREFVADQVEELEAQLRAALAGAADGERVLAEWQARATEPLARRCTTLREWLGGAPLAAPTRNLAEHTLRRIGRRARDVLSDWAELLTDGARLRAGVARACPASFSDRDIEAVCSWCARQSEERVVETTGDEDERFVSLDGRDERVEPHAGRLDPPDDALLLYLHVLKQGALQLPSGRPLRYEHLVVDEAQDLAAVELRVLLAATTSRRCVTIAGDALQRLVFDNGFSDWETLLTQLEVPVSTNTTLRLGYRSTSEVMALARSLLGELAGATSTLQSPRSGAPVELHRCGSQGEAVAVLASALRSLLGREPLASVALIARHRAQAQTYAEALTRAEVPGVRLVDEDFSFRPGIEATWVNQVKGLEFDYVVLLDVDAATYPETQESRHLLHIAATRAAHQLWLVAAGPPSPVLPPDL